MYVSILVMQEIDWDTSPEMYFCGIFATEEEALAEARRHMILDHEARMGEECSYRYRVRAISATVGEKVFQDVESGEEICSWDL